MRDLYDVQIIALNLLSEGVAFDFYSAVIPVLDRLNILRGRYWTVHSEVDLHHLTMGLDLAEQVTPDSQKGRLYQRVLWDSATLYHNMLSSWVGEQAEPLQSLDALAAAA